MSDVRDLTVIDSSFAYKTAAEEVAWPDREVHGDMDRDAIQHWLGYHGFPGGKDVFEASIIGSFNGPFLEVRTWYTNPLTGKKMLIGGIRREGESEVAQELRVVPLACLPGELPGSEPPDFTDVRNWAAHYGVGKKLARPIVGRVDCSFVFTEWHVEDGKVGLRTTLVKAAGE